MSTITSLVITPAEARQLLGKTKQNFYRLLNSGEIPGAFKLGGRWAIKRDTFESWLKNV